MAISTTRMRAFKSELNAKIKPLVTPFVGTINALPISSSLKNQLKNYPATYFLDSFIRNVIGDPVARSLLSSMTRATGRKSEKVGTKTFRVAYKYGDPGMLTQMQLLFLMAKYPKTAATVIKKRVGLAGYPGVGNYSTGMGDFGIVSIPLIIAIIGLIGAIGGPLIVVLGPMIFGFIGEMMGGGAAPAPLPAGTAPGGALPGGPGPAFGPTFDMTTPGAPGTDLVVEEEGPPIALIVGGTALLGGLAWVMLRPRKKRR